MNTNERKDIPHPHKEPHDYLFLSPIFKTSTRYHNAFSGGTFSSQQLKRPLLTISRGLLSTHANILPVHI